MSMKIVLAIVLGSSISAVIAYLVVSQFDVANAHVIGGGVGGAVGAAVGQSLGKKTED